MQHLLLKQGFGARAAVDAIAEPPVGEPVDLYVGYGRVLTRETWYEDVFRAELRWFF